MKSFMENFCDEGILWKTPTSQESFPNEKIEDLQHNRYTSWNSLGS